MLYSGRYLFILDGLEIMQHQGGDQYGLLKSSDFRKFLEYFAAPDHESFCLVTSRAPLSISWSTLPTGNLMWIG